jgi:hypothetical protein
LIDKRSRISCVRRISELDTARHLRVAYWFEVGSRSALYPYWHEERVAWQTCYILMSYLLVFGRCRLSRIRAIVVTLSSRWTDRTVFVDASWQSE